MSTIAEVKLGNIESAFYRELGRKLESKRKERGWHQQDLAAEIGVHRNTLLRWESGEGPIPIWMLLRLCDILCCQHLLLLPAREFTWGMDYTAMRQERDRMRKRVQAERDPRLTDLEEKHLRKQVMSA
jgi:transcriptional regulator with XRE-family HTH domain